MGFHITSTLPRKQAKPRRQGANHGKGSLNCLPPPERLPPLPRCGELGITWKQRHALTTIRKLENEVIKDVGVWVGPKELKKIEQIEALYQQHFPSDWARAQEKASIKRAAQRARDEVLMTG